MFERITSTNTSRLSFTIQGNDPTVSKVASIHDALPGTELNYTIAIRNPGSGTTLTAVRIEDILPKEFTYLYTNSVVLA